MATKEVLRTAINKLKYNTMTLMEKRGKCTNAQEVKNIDRNIAQNESMILDYEYRLKNDLG